MSCELGVHRIHLAETDSTNRYARERTTDGAFTLITTDHQTAGRGQRGTVWESSLKTFLHNLTQQFCRL